MSLEDAHVTVTARFLRTGSVLQGTARGECTGFEITVAVRTDADPEAVRSVLRMAHATCYTESCLRSAVQIQVCHVVNGQPLTSELDPL